MPNMSYFLSFPSLGKTYSLGLCCAQPKAHVCIPEAVNMIHLLKILDILFDSFANSVWVLILYIMTMFYNAKAWICLTGTFATWDSTCCNSMIVVYLVWKSRSQI